MINNKKKKKNKLFTTIIECSLFVLIIYLFVSYLFKNNIIKGGNNVEANILTKVSEPVDPNIGRKLFRVPYVGEKRRCFIYVSPKSQDGENLVKIAPPPITLTWSDFKKSKSLEDNPKDIEDDFVWLDMKMEDEKFEYKN